MDKIEWTKEIATGIKKIDDQHKAFIRACAEAVQSAEKGLKKEKIMASMKELEKIAMEHFSTEEGIMAGSVYPDKEGHARLHEFFMEELEKVMEKAKNGETGPDFAAGIKEKLADWFILHIRKNDIKMASYIINK